jgi:DNA/RNA endonuclease YhcR with UshA esterase domain
MRKLLLGISALFLTVALGAQEEIKMDELSKHTDDSVIVCTKIFGGIYLDRSKGTPTFLNAGGNYPDAPLTIVIWSDARATFKEAPEEFYKGKNVCVTGKLTLYKDKPQIVVYDAKQIKVKEE